MFPDTCRGEYCWIYWTDLPFFWPSCITFRICIFLSGMEMQEHFKSDSDTDIKLKTFYVGRIYPMIKIWQKLFVICNGIIQAWQLAISLMRTHKLPKLCRHPYMQLTSVEPFGLKVGILARDFLLAFWQVHTAHVFLNICRDAIASAAIADDWKRIDRPVLCFQCGEKTSLQKSRGFVPMVCNAAKSNACK